MIGKDEAAPNEEAAGEQCDQPHQLDTQTGHAGPSEQTGWADLPLDPEHVAMLVASEVTAEQARLRGYESISDRRRPRDDFGFSERVADRVPGLLIPRPDVDGQVWGYQFRPDSPFRPDNGGLAKYETRHGDPNPLDIPPGVDAGTLGAHDQDLMFTKVTMVNYARGATHQDWDRALAALPDDAKRQARVNFPYRYREAHDDLIPVPYETREQQTYDQELEQWCEKHGEPSLERLQANGHGRTPQAAR